MSKPTKTVKSKSKIEKKVKSHVPQPVPVPPQVPQVPQPVPPQIPDLAKSFFEQNPKLLLYFAMINQEYQTQKAKPENIELFNKLVAHLQTQFEIEYQKKLVDANPGEQMRFLSDWTLDFFREYVNSLSESLE